jgi:hypothetical protein
MEEGKIATVSQFGATERSPSMYMRVLPWSNTLLAWQVGINFSPLVNQPVTSAIERSGIWKKVR